MNRPCTQQAFGDGDNDASLLRWAAIGCAVANADAEAKSAAGVVLSRAVEDDAVAHVLEAVIDAKRRRASRL